MEGESDILNCPFSIDGRAPARRPVTHEPGAKGAPGLVSEKSLKPHEPNAGQHDGVLPDGGLVRG